MKLHQSKVKYLAEQLLRSEPVHTGEWQAMDTSKSKIHATYEMLDICYSTVVPEDIETWQKLIEPDLPWAERHFQERVSGIPYNPPPSHTAWPYAVSDNQSHIHEGIFDHTYPERFWPKHAGCKEQHRNWPSGGSKPDPCVEMKGIRFQYGDLKDVIDLLNRRPLTRQAFLPVWFPEDTGAPLGQRVPCTLGYHFMIRDSADPGVPVLSCRYFIRSCDLVRHFTNDVYMAGRLMQYVANHLHRYPVHPGEFIMYISSLHAFMGDKTRLQEMSQ